MVDSAILEALASLEMLMTEFFAPVTGNSRKREIESMLENFSNRRDSWKQCLCFLEKSSNQYVLMFTMTSLENLINRHWMTMHAEEKTEIRCTLWNFLTGQHQILPNFVRNKLAKLIVDIARYDWPHFYPDFFSNIMDLINSNGKSIVLGLVLAHATSEELGSGREGSVIVSTTRRAELQRHLLRGVPQLLHSLSAILEKYTDDRDKLTNPPPSPAHGISYDDIVPHLPDLLATTKEPDTCNRELESEIIIMTLQTLQHMFSWLPLSSHVPPSLVSTVFYWASVATQLQYGEEVTMQGLGTINELLYRRYAPPSSAATALRLHHCSLRLLRHLSQPLTTHNVSPEYFDRLTEFLRLFVSLHFKRLEAEPEFDAIEFLSYLFQFTFQTPSCAIFVSCLEIWLQFIDTLKPEDSVKYNEPLLGLANGVLNKIQFQYNKAPLQMLDNETVDDDGETEWQAFLRNSIECIARVAELSPLQVFTIALERWQCLVGVHARAGGRLPGSHSSMGADDERLLAALLDLASITRVLGRLAPTLFQDESSSAGCSAGAAFLEHLCEALAAAGHARPHAAPAAVRASGCGRAALIAVHSEMFACMGAWVCYANKCQSEVFLQRVITYVLPFLLPRDIPDPPELCHAAAHLLLTVATHIKMNLATPNSVTGELFQQAECSLHYLEPKTATVMRNALATLAAWGPASEGTEVLRRLVEAWCAPLLTSAPAGPGPACHQCLPALADLVLYFEDHPMHSKKALANAIERPVRAAMAALDADSGQCAGPVASLFLALFTSMQQQLGEEFVQRAVNLFLQVATREGLCEKNEGSAMEQLLVVLRLAVEGGGAWLPGALGRLLRLVLHHALPAVERAPQHPHAQLALYQLLGSILVHRWRYFFGGVHGMNAGVAAEADVERLEELRTILSAIGRSLLQSDINIFKLNLEILENVNNRWKLYHKAMFCSEFLPGFLSVVVGCLVERRHALLREELVCAAYALAAVDFPAFFCNFLPQFVSARGLTRTQQDTVMDFQHETDLPTFSQNLQRLVNDIHCYSVCNSSLAAQHDNRTL